MANVVPVRHAPGLDVPVGDHVITPLQYAIQRSSVGHQTIARVGIDQVFDQLIDDRILQTHGVAAAGLVGGGAHPELALLVTR
ncbi:hypothetical protein D3C80_1827100 [compost metagenome]